MEQPDTSSHPLVGLIMGSKSDWDVLQPAAKILTELGVPFSDKAKKPQAAKPVAA